MPPSQPGGSWSRRSHCAGLPANTPARQVAPPQHEEVLAVEPPPRRSRRRRGRGRCRRAARGAARW
eukprot:5795527-Lingulodinium_polyedra.AAC.1